MSKVMISAHVAPREEKSPTAVLRQERYTRRNDYGVLARASSDYTIEHVSNSSTRIYARLV